MSLSKNSRRTFLKNIGIGLLSGPFLLEGLSAADTQRMLAQANVPFNCVLTPRQTGGPFYIDPKFERKDITEGEQGLPLTMNIQVIGVKNCQPVPNAVVNIWHCSVDGEYSEFGGATNDTWFKGYQKTDAQGNCQFETIYPGFYPGRVHHIHFDVHIGFEENGTVDQSINPSSSMISQIYFPDALSTKIHTELSPYKEQGVNDLTLATDILLNANDLDKLVATVDESNYPNVLTANFCVGLDMDGETSTNLEAIKGYAVFELKDNFPNPFSSQTKFNFVMKTAGTVTLSIFSLKGELVDQLVQKKFPQGEFSITFNRHHSYEPLPAGNYIFDMIVHTPKGRFRQAKEMTIF